MKIPFVYMWRSLWTRRLTTALTLGGVALVSFVFAAVLMLSHGVEKAMVDSGDDRNAILLRKGATGELVSQIDRDAANIVRTLPEVAVQADGSPFASPEIVVIINLLKNGTKDMGNVTVRGIAPGARAIRPQAKLLAGKWFAPGTGEVMVGANIADRFQGTAIGQTLRFGDATWTIVGHFEAGGTTFDSEVWGDVEQLGPAVGRPVFSSLLLRMREEGSLDEMRKRMGGDPRLQAYEVKQEVEFYREQSGMMATFIRVLGLIVTMIFSIGAVIGAMITMYAAVANRTVEIGTMRALGFRRRNVLGAFLVESILLSSLGGAAGIALASLMSFVRISTTNFGSFSELGFGFAMSPEIVVSTLVFALGMGITGGFLPAARAARLDILTALRSG
jgi:ABC-type lipoprotein release transport system permease subunit